MTDGTLRMLPSGQWAIAAPGRVPVPIVAGEIFLLEVQGERELVRVRIERKDGLGRWYAVPSSGRTERSVELREGLRAGFFDQRERYAKVL